MAGNNSFDYSYDQLDKIKQYYDDGVLKIDTPVVADDNSNLDELPTVTVSYSIGKNTFKSIKDTALATALYHTMVFADGVKDIQKNILIENCIVNALTHYVLAGTGVQYEYKYDKLDAIKQYYLDGTFRIDTPVNANDPENPVKSITLSYSVNKKTFKKTQDRSLATALYNLLSFISTNKDITKTSMIENCIIYALLNYIDIFNLKPASLPPIEEDATDNDNPLDSDLASLISAPENDDDDYEDEDEEDDSDSAIVSSDTEPEADALERIRQARIEAEKQKIAQQVAAARQQSEQQSAANPAASTISVPRPAASQTAMQNAAAARQMPPAQAMSQQAARQAQMQNVAQSAVPSHAQSNAGSGAVSQEDFMALRKAVLMQSSLSAGITSDMSSIMKQIMNLSSMMNNVNKKLEEIQGSIDTTAQSNAKSLASIQESNKQTAEAGKQHQKPLQIAIDMHDGEQVVHDIASMLEKIETMQTQLHDVASGLALTASGNTSCLTSIQDCSRSINELLNLIYYTDNTDQQDMQNAGAVSGTAQIEESLLDTPGYAGTAANKAQNDASAVSREGMSDDSDSDNIDFDALAAKFSSDLNNIGDNSDKASKAESNPSSSIHAADDASKHDAVAAENDTKPVVSLKQKKMPAASNSENAEQAEPESKMPSAAAVPVSSMSSIVKPVTDMSAGLMSDDDISRNFAAMVNQSLANSGVDEDYKQKASQLADSMQKRIDASAATVPVQYAAMPVSKEPTASAEDSSDDSEDTDDYTDLFNTDDNQNDADAGLIDDFTADSDSGIETPDDYASDADDDLPDSVDMDDLFGSSDNSFADSSNSMSDDEFDSMIDNEGSSSVADSDYDDESQEHDSTMVPIPEMPGYDDKPDSSDASGSIADDDSDYEPSDVSSAVSSSRDISNDSKEITIPVRRHHRRSAGWVAK